MPQILIVEDDAEVCEVLSIFVSDVPEAHVTTLPDALDAWLAVQKQKFDLIITDHRMPYLNGHSFCQALRKKKNPNQNTPIILLSGFLGEVERIISPDDRIYFLEKPPKLESFEELLVKLVTKPEAG
ncbi:MAG: response regulator [Oligoflexus sp.]